MSTIAVTTPLTEESARSLRAGDEVEVSGVIYTARDAAHKRLCSLIDADMELPVDLQDQIVYFVGPAPAKPGQPIGSAGPTTSCRMDPYSPGLIAHAGLRGMIGKGNRGSGVVEAMKEHGCVYLAAIGGAGALIARHITSASIVCYEDLGTEAIRRLEVDRLPAIVAIDTDGGSLYNQGPAAFSTVRSPSYRRTYDSACRPPYTRRNRSG